MISKSTSASSTGVGGGVDAFAGSHPECSSPPKRTGTARRRLITTMSGESLDFRVHVFQPQVAADGFDPDHGFAGFGVDPGPAALLPHVLLDPRNVLGDQNVRR